MQFHTAVGPAGQASTPKHPDLEPIVPAVLLGHHIGGGLRCTENRMQGPIDATGLVDPMVILFAGVVESGRMLGHRHLVGRIPIDFVGAHVAEHSIRGMPPYSLEHVERPDSVDLEVDQRNLSGFIVRGLRRAVDDQLGPVLAYQLENRLAISHVDRMRFKSLGLRFEQLEILERAALVPKEHSPHVVVDTDDLRSLGIPMPYRRRTDQSARSCDQDFHKASVPEPIDRGVLKVNARRLATEDLTDELAGDRSEAHTHHRMPCGDHQIFESFGATDVR